MNITLTPSTGSPITFGGTIVYGTTFYDKRLNQVRQECSDGSDVVFDGGPTKSYGILLVKRISYDDGEALRTWLAGTLYFQKYTFTISALTNVNLGKGKNTQVTGCRYLKNNSDGLLEFVAPGMYNLTMEYSF
jgi:hypothetical protein